MNRLSYLSRRKKDNIKLSLRELALAFGDWTELAQDRMNCRALENVNILSYVVEFCDHMTELRLPKEEGVNGLLSVINRFQYSQQTTQQLYICTRAKYCYNI